MTAPCIPFPCFVNVISTVFGQPEVYYNLRSPDKPLLVSAMPESKDKRDTYVTKLGLTGRRDKYAQSAILTRNVPDKKFVSGSLVCFK